MRLSSPGHPHLTYCTNIHPGETWAEVRANLERYVLAVRREVALDRRFGVGLRLSAQAAATLAEPAELEAFRGFLATHGLYVFTINGFPYGVFHGARVKEAVYLPDWMDEARLVYTDRLAELLAALLPDEPDLDGSVSTVPGAFKARVAGEADAARMAELMVRHAATVAETVEFFERHLFSRAAAERLAALAGLGHAEAEAFLRRHLGVCFDACHMAVEFEEPGAALDAFQAAGIRVGKIQISAGLAVGLAGRDPAALEALRPFAEGVYLHQVVERSPGGLRRFADLPEALAAAGRDGGEPREWRIHFHVPLFRERLGRFLNTQGYLRELLARLRRETPSRHLEVETYTWDVLPEEYRRGGIVGDVARELRWVIDRMTGVA